MIVIGIDPGFASLGWAIAELEKNLNSFTFAMKVRETGVIKTEKALKKVQIRSSEDSIRRAQEILSELNNLAGIHHPNVIATESMSWPRNAGIVAKMGITWGVIASFAHFQGLPMVQSSPIEIKKRTTGNGKASKEEIIEWAKPWANLPEQQTLQEHAADALGAIWAAKDSEVFKWVAAKR